MQDFNPDNNPNSIDEIADQLVDQVAELEAAEQNQARPNRDEDAGQKLVGQFIQGAREYFWCSALGGTSSYCGWIFFIYTLSIIASSIYFIVESFRSSAGIISENRSFFISSSFGYVIIIVSQSELITRQIIGTIGAAALMKVFTSQLSFETYIVLSLLGVIGISSYIILFVPLTLRYAAYKNNEMPTTNKLIEEWIIDFILLGSKFAIAYFILLIANDKYYD